MSLRWRPLADELGGMKKQVAFDEDGKIHVRYIQSDAQIKACLDNNAEARNHTPGRTKDKTMVRAASIPYWVGFKWLNEEGWWFEDPHCADRLMKKLNSYDWAYLRTGGGHLAMTQEGGFR